MTKYPDIAIIGAGITGLCVAHFLVDYGVKGSSITIFEESKRIGGNIYTAYLDHDNSVIELGAGRLNTILHPKTVQLCKQMNLEISPYSYPVVWGASDTEINREKLKEIKHKLSRGKLLPIDQILSPDEIQKLKKWSGYDLYQDSIHALQVLTNHPETQSLLQEEGDSPWIKIKNGFSRLPEILLSHLLDKGVTLYTEHKLYLVSKLEDNSDKVQLHFETSFDHIITAFSSTVISLPISRIQSIDGLYNRLPFSLTTNNLLLVKGYIQFTQRWWEDTRLSQRDWFMRSCCVVGDTPLRKVYLLEVGRALLFYCDSEYATQLIAVMKEHNKHEILRDYVIRHFNLDSSIAFDIIDSNLQVWNNGVQLLCNIQQQHHLKINDNIYCASSSFTSFSGWIEGCVLSAQSTVEDIVKK